MVLVFVVSFSHSKTLAGLHAFVNAKKQERAFFGLDAVKFLAMMQKAKD